MSFRISTHYHSIVCQDIILTHQLNNVMQLPRIKRCTLNSPSKIGAHIALESITGQKAARVEKSRVNLKLRKNNNYAVNLRRKSLYNFLDHFLGILSPGIYNESTPGKVIRGEHEKYNFGVSRFTDFSLLQWHFLALSNQGGVNCEFSFFFPKSGAFSMQLLKRQRNISFFSAFQFPCTL